MNINGTVHCLFEQSGTFKNEFRKLNIKAMDYDIQNSFKETDCVIDLFNEIEQGYEGNKSIFDHINIERDLCLAFFPCIEFSGIAQTWYSLTQRDMVKWEYKKRIDYMIEKNSRRAYMFELLIKLCGIALCRKFRLVIENPWSLNTYLKQNIFLKHPDLIDQDRTKRGDFFKKPTAYWFFNCEPTIGHHFEKTPVKDIKQVRNTRKSKQKGICSTERSMISPTYARNFIYDFLIGDKRKSYLIPGLFDD